MISNPAKYQLMYLGKNLNYDELSININGEILLPKKEHKLLGITLDDKLTFCKHIKTMCSKANNKVSAFRRIRKFVSLEKAKILYNAFVSSTFNYCPLIWMFCSKTLNNLINKTHKRALKVLYQKSNTTLTELVTLDNSETIHVKNLHSLLIEVFKSLNSLNPTFINNLFTRKSLNTSLRRQNTLILPTIKANSKGTATTLYRCISLWNSLNPNITNEKTVKEFKSTLTFWSGKGCICKICQQ